MMFDYRVYEVEILLGSISLKQYGAASTLCCGSRWFGDSIALLAVHSADIANPCKAEAFNARLIGYERGKGI
jgi:hypothetical protein